MLNGATLHLTKSVEIAQAFFTKDLFLQPFAEEDIRISVKHIRDTFTALYEEEWQGLMQKYRLLDHTPIEVSYCKRCLHP